MNITEAKRLKKQLTKSREKLMNITEAKRLKKRIIKNREELAKNITMISTENNLAIGSAGNLAYLIADVAVLERWMWANKMKWDQLELPTKKRHGSKPPGR